MAAHPLWLVGSLQVATNVLVEIGTVFLATQLVCIYTPPV